MDGQDAYPKSYVAVFLTSTAAGLSLTILMMFWFLALWVLKVLYLLTPWSRVLLEKLTSKLCS